MPWTVSEPPAVAKNWTDAEKERCVAAANAALKDGKSDADAIYACIAAAGKGNRMKNKVERLVMVGADLEIRVEGEGAEEKKRIGGYAAVFDSWSNDLGGFRERIAPGAFAKTLQEADVRGLLNHDPNYVLGRTKAETLELSEDGKGLRFSVTPPDTQWAKDLLVSIQRGDINQMSFGFRTIKDTWGKGITDENGRAVRERTLLEVALFDVSVVTFPAYPATEAGLRAWNPEELYTPEPPELGHSDEPGQATHSTSEPGQALHSLRRLRINLYERCDVEA